MMPDALEALRSGDVEGAMANLKQEVRKAPRDARQRTFLFQMFCITGEWDRALTQLSVAAELDPLALPMSQAYQAAIRCEVLREKVFRGERSPTVLGDPGDWLPMLIEATRLLGTGKSVEAAQLRDNAFEAAPATEGTLNGTPFEWIADSDPRLGPVLEVFVNGNYMWVPFTRLSAVHFEPPVDLRDQVWMPAQFTWNNAGEAAGFIPTRYPGSATAKDPAIALSRRTEWIDAGDDWSLPVGQRVFVTSADETALMDTRKLVIAPPIAGPA
jgi:type VI secretion system protein ImpE